MNSKKLIIFLVAALVLIGSYIIYIKVNEREYYIKTIDGSSEIGDRLVVTSEFDGHLMSILPEKLTITSEGTSKKLAMLTTLQDDAPKSYKKYFRGVLKNYNGRINTLFQNERFVGFIDYYSKENFQNEIENEGYIKVAYYDKHSKQETIKDIPYEAIDNYEISKLENAFVKNNTIYFVIREDLLKSFYNEGGNEVRETEEIMYRAFAYNVTSGELKIVDEEKINKREKEKKAEAIILQTSTGETLFTKNPFVYVVNEVGMKKNLDQRELGSRHVIMFDYEKEEFRSLHQKYNPTEEIMEPFFVQNDKLFYLVNKKDSFNIRETDLTTGEITEKILQNGLLRDDFSWSTIKLGTDGKLILLGESNIDSHIQNIVYVFDVKEGKMLFNGYVATTVRGKELRVADRLSGLNVSLQD